MRKMYCIVALGLIAIAGVFANGRGEMTTIEGKLSVYENIPVIETETEKWALPPNAFYRLAWEQNLKVGDKLSIQGFSKKGVPEPGDEIVGRIMPVTVKVNGKEMDLSVSKGFGKDRISSRGPRDGGRIERRSSNHSNCDKGSRNRSKK